MPKLGWTPDNPALNFQVFNENCLDGLNKIPEGSVDFVFCDPPYGVTQAHWDSIISFDELWPLLLRVTKPSAAIVLMACQPFTTDLIQSKRDLFKYVWYWNREGHTTGHLDANRRPLRVLEELIVFYRQQPTYNPQFTKTNKIDATLSGGAPNSSVYGKNRPTLKKLENLGKRFPTNLLNIKPSGKTTKRHPHEKPISLIEYMVNTYTNPGERVLDFAMGGGSTGIGCANTGRRFVGFETEREYFIIARGRISGAYERQPSLKA